MNRDEAQAFMHEWGDWTKWSDARAMVQEAYGRGLVAGLEQGRKADKNSSDKLQVWFGSMPESNGRTNWTAILHRGDMSEGHTINRSQYPGRVRYAADCVRWLLGELEKKPFILDYDGDELTPCHLCGGTGEKDGKPCWGLNFEGTVHEGANRPD